jgi:hypothetical protein
MFQKLKNALIHVLGGYTSNEYDQHRYEAQNSMLKLILWHFNDQSKEMYSDGEKFRRIWSICQREFNQIEKYLT